MTAESRDMAKGRIFGERPHYFSSRQKTAQRHPATQRLTNGQDIGRDAPVLKSEPFARPTETRLDFVKDEQRPYFVASLPQRRQKIVGWDDDACFALNGLSDDGSDRFVNALQCRHITEGKENDIGKEWFKGTAVNFPSCHRQRTHRVAMKTVLKGDELFAPRELARQFERPFVRLRPAVRRVVLQLACPLAAACPFKRPFNQCHQLFGEGYLHILHELAINHHMQVAFCLPLDGSDDFRASVPDVGDGDP